MSNVVVSLMNEPIAVFLPISLVDSRDDAVALERPKLPFDMIARSMTAYV